MSLTAPSRQVLSVHADRHSWPGVVAPAIDRYIRDAPLIASSYRATGVYAEYAVEAYCVGPACCGDADTEFEFRRPARREAVAAAREKSTKTAPPLERRGGGGGTVPRGRRRAPDVSPIRSRASDGGTTGGGSGGANSRPVTLPPISGAAGDAPPLPALGAAAPVGVLSSGGDAGTGAAGRAGESGSDAGGTDDEDGLGAEGASAVPASMAFLAV